MERCRVQRWADRLVIETNLMKTWRALIGRYLQRAEIPFSIDPETLQRNDRPPDYIAFREGVINLLIHQDYADHTRKPVIRSFSDRVIMWNPGDAFASTRELLDPGEKEVRNPRIVAAFRRIGLSEQAGTGIRAIFGNWQRLGRVPPAINNDRARKAFQLTLSNEELLSEEQLRFQVSLGLHLDEAGARAFALVCREGQTSPRDVRAATGLAGDAARSVLERLAAEGLISPLEGAETLAFAVAEDLKDRLGQAARRVDDQADAGSADLVTDQPRPDTGGLVTDQAPSASSGLSTAQVGTSPASLSTAQPPSLSTAQAEPLVKLSATPLAGSTRRCKAPCACTLLARHRMPVGYHRAGCPAEGLPDRQQPTVGSQLTCEQRRPRKEWVREEQASRPSFRSRRGRQRSSARFGAASVRSASTDRTTVRLN